MMMEEAFEKAGRGHLVQVVNPPKDWYSLQNLPPEFDTETSKNIFLMYTTLYTYLLTSPENIRRSMKS